MFARLTARDALSPVIVHRLDSPGFTTLFVRMVDAVRTRHVLAELDPRLLKDIGISRADAIQESARAPWDLAPVRRR